jgi:plastocyanin
MNPVVVNPGRMADNIRTRQGTVIEVAFEFPFEQGVKQMRLLNVPCFTTACVLLLSSTSIVQAQGYGTIKGQVILPNPPSKSPINVTVDKEHCLSKGELYPTDLIVDPKSKGVQNVVVWLRPDDDNRKAVFPQDKIKPELLKAPPKTHVIDQPCCQFEPRVIAARAGDKLLIKNSAPVPHNINYSSDIESFNVTLPPGKSHEAQQTLQAQSSPIPFKCDIHPWMAGRVRVFDHPYFAVTDKEGKFEIKDVPAGKWRIVYWHENGYHKGRNGLLGFAVEVQSDSTTTLEPVTLELP